MIWQEAETADERAVEAGGRTRPTLEARPRHLFSQTYDVLTSDRRVAAIDLAAIRSRGRFELDGVEYRIRPEGWTAGVFVLEREGRDVARVERTGWLPARYRVRLEDRSLELRAHGLTRRFTLWHGGRRLGDIRPRHLLSRTALFEDAGEVPVAIRVFLLAVIVLRWRRRSRSS